MGALNCERIMIRHPSTPLISDRLKLIATIVLAWAIVLAIAGLASLGIEPNERGQDLATMSPPRASQL